jgi:hypothetical protein
MQPNLTTSPGSGTQTSTQSPQSANQGGGLTNANASYFQTGSPASMLTSQNGITLQQTPLSVVNINSTTATPKVQVTTQPKHHVNGLFLGLSLVLFLVAMALFWLTIKSANNTTD